MGRGVLLTLRRRAGRVLTALHAAVILLVVESLIRWVPLPRLGRLLRVRLNLDPAPPDPEVMSPTELPRRAQGQLRAASRVTEAWPLSKGPCLRRSLVAGHLLRRHDPSIRLGVGGDGDRLRAHAWLEIDGRPLEDPGELIPFQEPPTGAIR